MRPNGMAGKLLTFAAPGVYSVYVIHVHPKVFWSGDLIALLRPWDSWNCMQVLLALVTTAMCVFAACIVLDRGRQRLFRLLGVEKAAEQICDRIEMQVGKALAD